MLGSKKKLCPASWSGLRLKPALDKGPATLFLDFVLTKFCDNLRTTASLNFGIFTNSQLFGRNHLSAILLTTWDFQDPSSRYCFSTSANWPDKAGPVFVETRFLIFISLKISRVSSSTPWSLTVELASLTWEEVPWFSVTADGLWYTKSLSLLSSILDWDAARDMGDSEH